MMKVISTKFLSNNWMYDFDDLHFYGDQRLIDKRQIYFVNYDAVKMLTEQWFYCWHLYKLNIKGIKV